MAVTLTLDLIEEASRFLGGRVLHTPLEPSPKLSQLLGVPIWLKLECLQTTGSFKLRGALFRLSRLSEEEKRAGVFTCSAGNHGKGVAYAAKALGVTPTIVVPSSIDESKYRAMAVRWPLRFWRTCRKRSRSSFRWEAEGWPPEFPSW